MMTEFAPKMIVGLAPEQLVVFGQSPSTKPKAKRIAKRPCKEIPCRVFFYAEKPCTQRFLALLKYAKNVIL